jgi:probable HAF family extracellular repeat protein
MRISSAFSFMGLLLAATLSKASLSPRYELVDIGTLPWVSDDVAPHLSASGEISWWQTTPDRIIHAAAWTSRSQQDIGTLAGFASSIASRANRNGQVIGWSVSGNNLVDSRATTHAYLSTGTQLLDLGTLGGRDSKATDINESGQVVGFSSLPDQSRHAFLYRAGRLLDLCALPGGAFSAAYAINNRGVVAGAAETPTHLVHAVIWRNNRIADLGTLPGGTRSRALALNDRGDIVGYSEADQAETHAFLYTNGRMQDLGSLGFDPVRANAINNHGQIVGASGVNQFARHAFIWENGAMQDLNKLVSPGEAWRLEEAYDITDQGQILCLGIRAGGNRDRHLILLKPVSAPTASTYNLQ